jgi:alkylhydroperoxidase family enzyme
VLVAAAASARQDSYCSFAWGSKLAAAADAGLAASVLRGDNRGLTDSDNALAGWARKVVEDPNSSTDGDIQALRDAGFDDQQIFAMTAFVALRLAFSTINDALGAVPDDQLRRAAPPEVVAAVDYGRL